MNYPIEEIESLEQEIREAEAEEKGRCDSCEAAMINGVRCHEHGCPRYARLQEMKKRLERLQDY